LQRAPRGRLPGRRRRRAIESLEIRDDIGVGTPPAIDGKPGGADHDHDREQHELTSRVREHAATIARARPRD